MGILIIDSLLGPGDSSRFGDGHSVLGALDGRGALGAVGRGLARTAAAARLSTVVALVRHGRSDCRLRAPPQPLERVRGCMCHRTMDSGRGPSSLPRPGMLPRTRHGSVRGIRYTHPRSRVCRLADLAGLPVHATPVYSILWNLLTGAALFRLFQLHASAAFLCGVYLLLSGLGRFVEEAYRGEPQTRVIAGLRFYQWIAIACVVVGAVLTCVQGSVPLPALILRPDSVFLAVACGALAWFVTGVDFPESTRRFARLT